INTAAVDDPSLVTEAAEIYGSQAVLVSIDARRRPDGSYEVFTQGGSRSASIDPVSHARAAEAAGAGEILLTSIDRDGTMEGYDIELIRCVTDAVTLPVVACGGAGKRGHLADPVREAGASAVAAGSLFVFQG